MELDFGMIFQLFGIIEQAARNPKFSNIAAVAHAALLDIEGVAAKKQADKAQADAAAAEKAKADAAPKAVPAALQAHTEPEPAPSTSGLSLGATRPEGEPAQTLADVGKR